MNLRDQILAKIGSIPSLPPAAVEAIPLLQDPDSDIGVIAKIIEHDPGLAANVLRLANSAYMGGVGSVGSVRQAIARIGTAHILQMVVGSAASRVMNGAINGYGLLPGELWKHSAIAAIITTELAQARSIKPPEEAFTSALLHDVGKLVLGQFVKVDIGPIQELAFEQQVSFEQAEREVLGIDHAEVGASLLESWGLPSGIVEAVRWHHEPQNASEDRALLVDLVHAAVQIATLSGIGGGLDGTNYHTSSRSVATMNIRPSVVEKVLCRTMDAFEGVCTIYETASRR